MFLKKDVCYTDAITKKMGLLLMRTRFTWEKNKKLIIMVFTISIMVVIAFVMGALIQETITAYQTQKAQEIQIEEERKAKQEKEEKIEQVLQESIYGEDLRKLYEQYPQMEEMLLQLEKYPEEMIEYLLKTPEAVDFVVAYPKYVQMTEEERRELALRSLDLDQYEMQGGVPVYYQWDTDWGYTKYGDQYLAVTGCAPVCLSMAAVALTGDVTLTPKKVADISEEMGAYVQGVGTSWELMTVGARQLGLASHQIDTWSVQAIRLALSEGKIVICSMGEGDFTTQGHFILIVGETEDGLFLVNDPNSKSNTHKEWDGQRLLDQMKAMWELCDKSIC